MLYDLYVVGLVLDGDVNCCEWLSLFHVSGDVSCEHSASLSDLVSINLNTYSLFH